ncbi:clostripain-related cysteine peptidase [Clostridium peptidivorans]|uniref:clostripain-related cysteine peptidase n=1 Tax=Clostridium peptidivorans TaxID=100174 RepID=UPI000BE471C2|nr:clostripain-related cysteine peptidase [Clostridium peptidivorans]
MNRIKKWTILIYADGNNEMVDAIYKNMLDCEKIGSNEDVNVVMQIGLINSNKSTDKNNWVGVRRYYMQSPTSFLIQDLDKANMADPNNLYEFIKWGFKNYKAEKYMIVLSDHGSNFIGCMTDLSLNIPYIMGIPEMIEAINSAGKNLGCEIDALVLDMCYMNSVEIVYELAQHDKSTIKSMVTYISHAPYEGLPYDKFVSLVTKYSSIQDLNLFLKHLIEDLNLSLTAYEINHKKLERVKKLFNDFAYSYICSKDSKDQSVTDLIKNAPPESKFYNFIRNINESLSTIIIYSNEDFNGLNKSIEIISKDITSLISFYFKLSFAKDNYWINLLTPDPLATNLLPKNKVNVRPETSSTPVVHYMVPFKGN